MITIGAVTLDLIAFLFTFAVAFVAGFVCGIIVRFWPECCPHGPWL